MNIKDFGAILHERWEKNSDNRIIGFWAEDGASYEIMCPPQLRDLIVQFQNRFADHYNVILEQERRLSHYTDMLEDI